MRGLLDAKVRNPVMVLDEIDKVGGATKSFGDPSAALLEDDLGDDLRCEIGVRYVSTIDEALDLALSPPAARQTTG